MPNAVEELLRFEAPSPIQSRWVARDVELHDTVIPGPPVARCSTVPATATSATSRTPIGSTYGG